MTFKPIFNNSSFFIVFLFIFFILKSTLAQNFIFLLLLVFCCSYVMKHADKYVTYLRYSSRLARGLDWTIQLVEEDNENFCIKILHSASRVSHGCSLHWTFAQNASSFMFWCCMTRKSSQTDFKNCPNFSTLYISKQSC